MILHITNDFSGSTVYQNLVKELDNLNIQQIVYSPIRDVERIGKNKLEFNNRNSEIIYSHILSKYFDRIFYRKKIKKIVNDIESKVNLKNIKFIHAHTWYSDGGVAYKLSKKYNIPYIVAVRNTDLNFFLKYFFHERKFGKKILLSATKIIIISAVYKNRILTHKYLQNIKNNIRDKIEIIPNGVDRYWLDNKINHRKKSINSQYIKLLYIGKFDKGKNVFNLINAVNNLNNKKQFKIKLILIGGTGNDEKRVEKLIKNNKNIDFKGQIFDKNQLRNCMQACDFFTMPSNAETFGLVYIEALLQGLPVLYTKNEGIDGYYDLIGEKVENTSIEEIEKKIILLIDNYDNYTYDLDVLLKNHDWRFIAENYQKIYIK